MAFHAYLFFGGNCREAFTRFGETFWSPMFGMCVDRFGTPWMVGAEGPAQGS
ncbi:MAG: hypothetical protein ACRDYV_01605 [Acidimicrobiia bacterium]